jgi:hypothetical protein
VEVLWEVLDHLVARRRSGSWIWQVSNLEDTYRLKGRLQILTPGAKVTLKQACHHLSRNTYSRIIKHSKSLEKIRSIYVNSLRLIRRQSSSKIPKTSNSLTTWPKWQLLLLSPSPQTQVNSSLRFVSITTMREELRILTILIEKSGRYRWPICLIGLVHKRLPHRLMS